jgi:hypothetical protein
MKIDAFGSIWESVWLVALVVSGIYTGYLVWCKPLEFKKIYHGYGFFKWWFNSEVYIWFVRILTLVVLFAIIGFLLLTLAGI